MSLSCFLLRSRRPPYTATPVRRPRPPAADRPAQYPALFLSPRAPCLPVMRMRRVLASVASARGVGDLSPCRQPHAYLYPARPLHSPPHYLPHPRPHTPNARTMNLQLCTLLLSALVSLAASSSTGEVPEGDGEGCGRAVQLRHDADERARAAVVSGRGVFCVRCGRGPVTLNFPAAVGVSPLAPQPKLVRAE